MIKVFDDGSVYIGEMLSNQRNGQGSLYMLDDFALGCKIEGIWQDDKLNGYAKILDNSCEEEGEFVNGVKTGDFLRHYYNGEHSVISYKNGVIVSTNVYLKGRPNRNKTFGCIKLNNDKYYLGDLFNGKPFGFGMIYMLNEQMQIAHKVFCEIYGKKVVNQSNIDAENQRY